MGCHNTVPTDQDIYWLVEPGKKKKIKHMRKGKILTVLPTDRQNSLEEWKFSYVY